MKYLLLSYLSVLSYLLPVVLSWNQNNFYVQEIQKTNLPFQSPKTMTIENLKTYKYYTSLLLQQNSGLLHKIVNSFNVRSLDVKEELFQEASIEYLNALKTFNIEKKVAFNTYAYIIVRRKLASFLLQYENAGIRTPKHLEQQYYQFMKNKENSSNKREKIYGEDKTKIMNRIGKSSPLYASSSTFPESNINIEDSENYLDDYFQENEQKEWLDRQAEILKMKKS